MNQLILAENIVLIILTLFSIVALVIGSISLHNFTTNSSPKIYYPTTSVAKSLQILETQSSVLNNQVQFPTNLQSVTFDKSFIGVPVVNMNSFEQLTFTPCNVFPESTTANAITFTVDCPNIQGLFGWPVKYGNNVPNVDSSNYAISAVIDPADGVYKPAVLLYHDIGGVRNLSYYLSQDVYGISWYPEVILKTLSLPAPAFWTESLSMTTLSSGQPAIVFPDTANMLDIVYMVGLDGRFASTSINLTIPRIAPFTASHYLQALLIEDKPAIAFVSLGLNTNIAVQHSSTATGSLLTDWTEVLSPNCAAVIDRGFNAVVIGSQIACVFACTNAFYDLFFIQSTIASWTGVSNIIPVATGSVTFDIVSGAITVNTITVGSLVVPIVGVTYLNTAVKYFRFYMSSTAQGGVGAWATQFELTTDSKVSPDHVSASSLPDGTLACMFYNTQQNMNTNVSYTVINGNSTGSMTFAEFSRNSTIGTSMTVKYLPNTGKVYGVYISHETLDSLGPTREIGAMFFSAPSTNFNMNVNVQVNLVATGLIAT